MRSRIERTNRARPSFRPDEAPELTPAELEAETAEALPERAVMSTLGVSGLDPASGSMEGIGDGVSGDHAATTESPVPAGETTHATPEATTMTPEPAQAPPNAPPAAEASHGSPEAAPATETGTSHASPEAAPATGSHSPPEHAGDPNHSDKPGFNPWAGKEHPGKAAEHSAVAA
jgi:hypothetical protein